MSDSCKSCDTKSVRIAELEESLSKRVSIEVYQQDFMAGWGAYLMEEGKFRPEAKPAILLNIGAFMASIEAGELQHEDLPYMVAETIMHEVIHVCEHWAGQVLSEEKVERLLAKYRETANRRTVWLAETERATERKAGE